MELKNLFKSKIALALLTVGLSTTTMADTLGDYREAIREAVQNNPGVQAASCQRWLLSRP